MVGVATAVVAVGVVAATAIAADTAIAVEMATADAADTADVKHMAATADAADMPVERAYMAAPMEVTQHLVQAAAVTPIAAEGA